MQDWCGQHTSGKVKSSVYVALIIVYTLEHEDSHCVLNKQHTTLNNPIQQHQLNTVF